jgi:hypothetical protein
MCKGNILPYDFSTLLQKQFCFSKFNFRLGVTED